MDIKSFSAMFQEYCEVSSLEGRDRRTYYLIDRYRDKVSARLLTVQEKLRAKGKLAFDASLREMLDRPNPLLRLIPKGEDYVGAYVPVPIRFKP